MTNEPMARGWAVQLGDGTVTADFDPHATEASIWWVVCGYADEVARAKAAGARAFRVELREITP